MITSCVKITRTDATVLGITELDQDLLISGVTYISGSGYTPSQSSNNDTLGVNNADVQGVLDVLGVDKTDILAGLYDFAEIEWFAYNVTTTTVVKTIIRGHWGECKLYKGRFVAEFRSLTQFLQKTIGEVTSPTCRADFADTRCGLNAATYTATGAVTAVTDDRQFSDIARTEEDNYYKYGLLTWTSGNNNGRSMEVKSYLLTGGAFILFQSMPNAIQVGDTYSVIAGCDKLPATCKTKFAASNIVNFRGEPFVPGNDKLMIFGGQ